MTILPLTPRTVSASAALLGLALLSLPTSALANNDNRQQSRSEQKAKYEKRRGSQHLGPASPNRRYRHFQQHHEARHLHEDPNREPYYTPHRLGFTIRF